MNTIFFLAQCRDDASCIITAVIKKKKKDHFNYPTKCAWNGERCVLMKETAQQFIGSASTVHKAIVFMVDKAFSPLLGNLF